LFRWEYAIREILHHSQDEADLREIYSALENSFPLEESDRRETRWGGRPAYQHVARSIISNLVKSGDVVRISRGRYGLTDQGRSRFARERQD